MADGRLLSPDYIYPNLPTLPRGQKVKLACPTWEVQGLLNYVITFSACKDTNNLFCLPMMCKEGERVTRSVVCDSATQWTIARQAPLALEFSKQGYWRGLPSPSLRDLPDQGLNPYLLHCRQILYHWSHQRSPPMVWSQTTHPSWAIQLCHSSPLLFRQLLYFSVLHDFRSVIQKSLFYTPLPSSFS